MSDKVIHSYSLDRNTSIRVIDIAEKYYGMDAFYFTDQELNPTTMQGKEFSPPDYQTIYSHHTFEEQKAIFFSSESASKYVEPIPLDQGILLYYVLIAIEHALILQEDRYKFYEEELYDTDSYYENNLRSDLLRLYIFIKELPYKRGAKNETILTINKGFSKWQKRISLDNFDNWIFRSALLKYCEDHLWNIHSLEEAKTELKQLTRVGRSLDNPNIYPFIYGTYTIFKDFAQDKTHISTRLCQIIVNYLIYLGLFADKDNDPLKMRSTIEYILSKKEMPRFPSHSLPAEELNSPTSPLRRPTHLFDDLVFQ